MKYFKEPLLIKQLTMFLNIPFIKVKYIFKQQKY